MPILIDKNQVLNLEQIDTTEKLFKRFPKMEMISNIDSTANRILMLPNNYLRFPVVYVMQHEYAIVCQKNNHPLILYTDDMTTCVAGILRNNRNGMICLCHFDRINPRYDLTTFADVIRLMSSSSNYDADFELKLIGGYQDERNISDQLVIDILRLFDQLNHIIHLTFAFVGKSNTKFESMIESLDNLNDVDANQRTIFAKEKIAKPKITNICVHVEDNRLYFAPANFIGDRCRLTMDSINTVPMYEIRRAFVSFRASSMRHYLSIYDHRKQLIRIPPLLFDRCYFGAGAKQYFQETLKFSDREILNHFSTSPCAEPKHFVIEMRQIFKFFNDHLEQYGFDSCDQMTNIYFPKGLTSRRFYLAENQNLSSDREKPKTAMDATASSSSSSSSSSSTTSTSSTETDSFPHIEFKREINLDNFKKDNRVSDDGDDSYHEPLFIWKELQLIRN